MIATMTSMTRGAVVYRQVMEALRKNKVPVVIGG
jgi:hypothetical protein